MRIRSKNSDTDSAVGLAVYDAANRAVIRALDRDVHEIVFRTVTEAVDLNSNRAATRAIFWNRDLNKDLLSLQVLDFIAEVGAV